MFKLSRQQFKTFLDTCDKELDFVEATFNTEKDNLRKAQNAELEGLYEDRRNKEVYVLPILLANQLENIWI